MLREMKRDYESFNNAVKHLLTDCQKNPALAECSRGVVAVDAAFKAVDKIAGMDISLHSYDIKAVTGGRDALGEVTVVIKRGDILYRGRGVSTDIIESSILAYIEAINRALSDISGTINGR